MSVKIDSFVVLIRSCDLCAQPLGIPSDFSRTFDGYTMFEEGLFILIHLVTTEHGAVKYLIVDISPNAANVLRTERPGFDEGHCHKWKSGRASAEHILLLEDGMAVTPREGVFRLAAMSADGAYVGPYSNQVGRHLADALLATCGFTLPRHVYQAVQMSTLCWESPCEFHQIQNCGRDTDKRFPWASQFDKLLAWLADKLNYGHGRVTFRGVAAHLGLKWRKILAPRNDNFKITSYSLGCARRFVYLYQALHGALAVEHEAICLFARETAGGLYRKKLENWNNQSGEYAQKRPSKPPKPPSPDVGRGMKEARNIRAYARDMISPGLLLFGLGRADLRSKFLCAYSLHAQSNQSTALVLVQKQHDMLAAMQAAIYGVAMLAGAVRFLFCLCWGRGRTQRWTLGRKALRLHIKVMAAHYAWRFIPSVVTALPDLLMPLKEDGSVFRGIGLTAHATSMSLRFFEAGAKHQGLEKKWREIEEALSMLARWLRVEASNFRKQIILWDVENTSVAPVADSAPPEFKETDAPESGAPKAEYLQQFDEAEVAALYEKGSADEVISVEDAIDPSRTSRIALIPDSAPLAALSFGIPSPTPTAFSSMQQSYFEMISLKAEELFTRAKQRKFAATATTDDKDQDDDIHEEVVPGIELWHRRRYVPAGRNIYVAVLARPAPVSRRRRFWECASKCFHPDVLATPCGETLTKDIMEALAFVYGVVHPVIFGLRPADFSTYVDPPPEMFEKTTVTEFIQEYMALRNTLVPRARSSAEWAGAYSVVSATIQMDNGHRTACKTTELIPHEECCPRPGWADLSLQLGRASCIGRKYKVCSSKHPLNGCVVVVRGFRGHVQELRLYKILMTMPYSEVKAAGCWRSLRAWHRLIMAGIVTSDALAEMVGSMCSIHARGLHGHRPALGDALNAVKLKAAGVTGMSKDSAFIKRTLDLYFGNKPWHFEVTDRTKRERAMGRPYFTGPSLGVDRLRKSHFAAQDCQWLHGDRRSLIANLGRRTLDARTHSSSRLLRNPKGGLLSRGLNRRDLRDALRDVTKAAEPDEIDTRMLQYARRKIYTSGCDAEKEDELPEKMAEEIEEEADARSRRTKCQAQGAGKMRGGARQHSAEGQPGGRGGRRGSADGKTDNKGQPGGLGGGRGCDAEDRG